MTLVAITATERGRRGFVALSRAAMLFRRLLWLALPIVGLVELGAHVYFAGSAPREPDWAGLPTALQPLRKPGDLVVITPEWAEPLARRALGDELMPLSDVARSDTSGYSHAIEVSVFGQRSSDLLRFRELTKTTSPPFTLRRLENPDYRRVLYSFADHVRPGELFVVDWNGEAERTCEFTDRARRAAGGLGGHQSYPRERFRCSGGERFFVGVTVFDDARYRPRRCIYAHPLPNSILRLRFPKVPRGQAVSGYVGLSYLIARDGIGTPVELTAYVDGKNIGRRLSSDQEGFVPFEFKVPDTGTDHVEVIIDVVSESHENRDFCFVAEMR